MKFSITKKSSLNKSRLGVLETAHGVVETPVFIPVGTQATVKGLTIAQLEELKIQILLANAYHLFLRPGVEIIEAAGGLHKFMGWKKPILTDSGGYQIFSLSRLKKVTEEGVFFKSPVDGAEYFLTPEKIIEIQNRLGADIIMPLDECLPYPLDHEKVKESVFLTGRWAQRSLEFFQRQNFSGPALFGIIQGGHFLDLRKISVELTASLNFDGFAIGGLSVGEPVELMKEMVAGVAALLPEEKPRYLMGVGSKEEIRQAVANGIDLFDCVLPTRIGRHGNFLTETGRENIRNARFARNTQPLVENCGCYTCRNFSALYLRHLFMSHEIVGPVLLSIHNIYNLNQFMIKLREEIKNTQGQGSWVKG
jgi:queuine tRNA-ribosyltransferase